jgi:hypothetical protein
MKQHSPYTRVEAPQFAPGDDYITRSLKGPFVDTGLQIKPGQARHGRVYLSIDTVREMAEILGLFDKEDTHEEEYECAQCIERQAKILEAIDVLS